MRTTTTETIPPRLPGPMRYSNIVTNSASVTRHNKSRSRPTSVTGHSKHQQPHRGLKTGGRGGNALRSCVNHSATSATNGSGTSALQYTNYWSPMSASTIWVLFFFFFFFKRRREPTWTRCWVSDHHERTYKTIYQNTNTFSDKVRWFDTINNGPKPILRTPCHYIPSSTKALVASLQKAIQQLRLLFSKCMQKDSEYTAANVDDSRVWLSVNKTLHSVWKQTQISSSATLTKV